MLINEFLPNPVGKDTEGEWIELFNNNQEIISLNGWQLKDASGKTFIFKSREIGPGEYLVLDYKTTKISLNNNGETIFLYNQKGDLIDKAEFAGAAPEGKSLIRQNGQFIFTDEPTPGKANRTNFVATQKENLVSEDAFAKVSAGPLNGTNIDLTNLFIGLFLALILAFVFVFIIKKLNLFSEE